MACAEDTVDVLVVGAGPTGLALASELAAFGVDVRVVDPKAAPVTESRALALQPRTLEVLRGPVTDRLLARGNPAVRLRWHAAGRTAGLPLFDLGLEDTAYPFVLFLSQAETETVLVEHLRHSGVEVGWGTRFVRYAAVDGGEVRCRLVDARGREGTVRARYLVGCDGAHSAVRQSAGIGFTGGRYPQTFLLADLDVDGLEPGSAHVWLGGQGPVFFFPLLRPAAWRLLAARPSEPPDTSPPGGRTATATDESAVAPGELQAVVDVATGGAVRLGAPVWSTAFRIHHRHAETYRAGRVFLAGDAAHIHSPAGAQGMNTGVQDAVNLGWKLALVCRGRGPESLLDTYDAERRPVGAFVVRFTDRAFTAATSTAPSVRFTRAHLAPRALALAGRLPRLRAIAFRTVAQLAIRYPDTLRGDAEAHRGRLDPVGRLFARVRAEGSPRPRIGERLPDLRVDHEGRTGWLHDLLVDPAFHLLLCGSTSEWDDEAVHSLLDRYGDLVRVRTVVPPESGPRAGAVTAVDDAGWRRLGVKRAAYLLVRPDGHLAYRQQGTDLADLRRVLERWLVPG